MKVFFDTNVYVVKTANGPLSAIRATKRPFLLQPRPLSATKGLFLPETTCGLRPEAFTGSKWPVQGDGGHVAESLGQFRLAKSFPRRESFSLRRYRRPVAPRRLGVLQEGLPRTGYVEKFPGSKELRDAEQNVKIDVALTGEYPGDGKEKPIAFPDPAKEAVRGERFALLPLPTLVEGDNG